MSRWKLVTAVAAVLAATVGIGVAEATKEEGWEAARLEPIPCESWPPEGAGVNPDYGKCFEIVGGPSEAVPAPIPPEIEQKTCDLPLPPQAPASAQRPPFCDEVTP